MKTQAKHRIVQCLFGLILCTVFSCQIDRQQSQEATAVAKMAIADQCTGDITYACATLGTSEETCNTLQNIGCNWSGNACLPSTNCDALDEATCNLVATSTAPIPSCTWTNPGCHGSIAEACRVYGTSEGECNALQQEGIHCQWSNGACIVQTDCEQLTTEEDCSISGTRAAYCTWGASCYGNLWEACKTMASTQVECDALNIGCRWFEAYGQCLPSENCESKDYATCKRVEQITGSIKSCSWGAQTVYEQGTCSGEPTPGGRNVCSWQSDPESCALAYVYGGLFHRKFPTALCYWDGTQCLAKETMCAEETSFELCFSLSISAYGMADCAWTPN